MHPYVEYVNPYLGKRLVELGLDKKYIKGEGCYLYDDQGEKYLDFIAAYGALPFGYNSESIWQAIREIEQSKEPSFVQPSLLNAAGELAKRLVELAPEGIDYVTFTNSGTESVEAAIKLCRIKTGKLGIVSTYNSFHGKTLGALSATGNSSYQKGFGAPVEWFKHIPYGDINALRQELEANAHQIAAFIVEPIQGEGGIVEPPVGYLRQVQMLCAEFEVLTIFDEIQTGLGRTSKLFACEDECTPDVILLAKALGGGIAPIGAVLCKGEVYTEDFGLKHSSTFAGNSLGARIGLRVLEMLTANEGHLLRDVARKGGILKEGLLSIQREYPEIIKKIRGRGLMLGIDFGNSKSVYPHSLLGVMAEQEILTPVIASYLLNTEKLRVAPTLNGASVIRIEPPLIVSEEQIHKALEAIQRTARMLAQRNTAACLGHLVGYHSPKEQKVTSFQTQPNILPKDDDGRFAFLIHPVDLANYTDFDKSLKVFSKGQLRDLASRWNDMVEPFVVSRAEIESITGKRAVGDFICVPRTAKQMLEMSKEQVVSEITQALEIARDRGAKIVGLGAYTSVVTVGGRSLLDKVDGIFLTTGNSYTVVSGVESVLIGAEKLGMRLNEVTAAVVGAGGAIGKASAVLLAEEVSELVLIGNPARKGKSEHRMLRVTVEILKHIASLVDKGREFVPGTLGYHIAKIEGMPDLNADLGTWIEFVKDKMDDGLPIRHTVDIEKWLPKADVILVATSSPEEVITSSMLKWGALVCDMSRPTNVSKDVLENRQDVLVIDGGVIEVPNRPDLGWDFGFDQGLAYACMSETMMLALEKHYENASIGADLNFEYLSYVRELANKHGFRIAGFRSFDRPIDEAVWTQVKEIRSGKTVEERGA